MQRFDGQCAVHARVEPISFRRQGPPKACNLLAWNVQAILNLERDSGAWFHGGRLEQHHLNGAELRTEAIEELGIDRSANEHENRSRPGGTALRRGDPNFVLEFYDSGILAAIACAHEMLTSIEEHTDFRPFSLGCGDQHRYFRPRKNRFIVGRNASIRLVLDCARDGFAVTGDHADALAEGVVKKVRTELQIKSVRREADHTQKKNDRDNGNQDVSDD